MLLLRILLGLIVAACLGLTAVLLWCFRVRGVRPRDVIKGHWHVRKEEGWRPGEAEGQMPGARFERFGEAMWTSEDPGGVGTTEGAAKRAARHV